MFKCFWKEQPRCLTICGRFLVTAARTKHELVCDPSPLNLQLNNVDQISLKQQPTNDSRLFQLLRNFSQSRCLRSWPSLLFNRLHQSLQHYYVRHEHPLIEYGWLYSGDCTCDSFSLDIFHTTHCLYKMYNKYMGMVSSCSFASLFAFESVKNVHLAVPSVAEFISAS